MGRCMKKVENYCYRVRILHLKTTDPCNKNFLRPYTDLLKNGTVVDGSLVWNQTHTVIHYV